MMLVLASESLSSVWVDEGVVKTDSQSPRVVDGKIIKFVGYLVFLSLFNVLLFEGGKTDSYARFTLLSPSSIGVFPRGSVFSCICNCISRF